jgi:hypothetical protein
LQNIGFELSLKGLPVMGALLFLIGAFAILLLLAAGPGVRALRTPRTIGWASWQLVPPLFRGNLGFGFTPSAPFGARAGDCLYPLTNDREQISGLPRRALFRDSAHFESALRET